MTDAEVLRALLVKIDSLESEVRAGREETAALRERLEYRDKVLVGWSAIGEHLGFTKKWAEGLGHLDVDPIPHEKRGLYVTARASALDAWKDRYEARVHANHVAGVNRRWAEKRGAKRGRSENGSAS